MSSFNRDSKSGGDKFGRKGNSFSSNKRFGDRDGGGKAFLYDATCAKCGKACQVPFKPAGGRPVFCSNCFNKPVGGNQPRPLANNFNQPRFDDRPRFDGNSNPDQFKGQFAALNAKLDAILRALNSILNAAPQSAKSITEIKEDKETKKSKNSSPKAKVAKKLAKKKK